jgi:hypothetical protein
LINCFSINLHTIPHNDKQKQVSRLFFKFFEKQKLKYHIYVSIQTLYSVLVEAPLAAIISNNIHGYNKLGTPAFGEFLPFFSTDPLILCQLDGDRRCTAIFRSLQRCLTRSMSGLWLGRSRTFRDLSRSHSCIVLAVCLGLLSCWKVNLHPSLRS